MQIAIKYCGGCNCTYQRGHAIKHFKSLFPEHNYVVGNENMVYDIWLVICGCEKKCVELQKLVASVRTFVVGSEAEFQKLIIEFKQFRNQDHQAVEKKKIRIHGEASYTRTFYWEDAHTFSRLTGDSSRLHLNYDFAQAHLFEGGGADFMTVLPRHPALFRPAPVAVHDEGDMPEIRVRTQYLLRRCLFSHGMYPFRPEICPRQTGRAEPTRLRVRSPPC